MEDSFLIRTKQTGKKTEPENCNAEDETTLEKYHDEISGTIEFRLRASQGAPETASALESKEDSTLEKVQELISMAANVITARGGKESHRPI